MGRLLAAAAFACLLLGGSASSPGAEPVTEPALSAPDSGRGRAGPVIYNVDLGWPAVPPGVAWSDMPGISVDAQDRVWLFTRTEPPVQVYDRSGKHVRSWGSGQVNRAHHIRIDGAGNVWLSDIGFHTVSQFTPEGKLLRTLGTRGEAGDDSSHLNRPTDMAVTSSGDVFVSDGYGNSRIVHFDKDGKFVKSWGRRGTGPGEFDTPHSIVADSKGRLYVADRSNARVQVFDAAGKLLAEWRDIVVPWGLWVTKTDEIWVCGSSPMPRDPAAVIYGCPPKDQVFMKFSPEGKLLELWTVPKGIDGHEKPGDCNWVHAIALDSKGDIYVGDIKGKRAQKFVRGE